MATSTPTSLAIFIIFFLATLIPECRPIFRGPVLGFLDTVLFSVRMPENYKIKTPALENVSCIMYGQYSVEPGSDSASFGHCRG